MRNECIYPWLFVLQIFLKNPLKITLVFINIIIIVSVDGVLLLVSNKLLLDSCKDWNRCNVGLTKIQNGMMELGRELL